MKRFSITRNLVLFLVAPALTVLSGCIAQAPSPDDHSQTDNEPRHAELVGVDPGDAPLAANNKASLAISGTTPLGGKVAGPQPEPWHGADGDPNGGPQPEPWKPHKFAPDPASDNSSAAAKP